MGRPAVRVLAIGAGIAAGLSIPAGVAAQPSDPPGNNGTIKVDGEEFEPSDPNNEPHVDCPFQIDWFGFDEGDLFSDVTFITQSPTPPGDDDILLLEDTVFIGEDDNSGGGSPEGLDATETYDLSAALADITPHPVQGWHVKLVIAADGAQQGEGPKEKVFWVDNCPQVITTTTSSTTSTSSTSTSSTSSTTSTSIAPTTVTTAGPTTTTPTTAGVTTTTSAVVLGTVVTQTTTTTAPTTTTAAEVLGVQIEQAPAPAPVPAPQPAQPAQPTVLATTGAPLAALTALGAGLVIAGQSVRRKARRSGDH